MNTTALIESAIKHEEWCFEQARPEDKHFWDGWSADAVRAGHVVATVTTSARGTGHVVIVTRRLMVMSPEGKALAYVPGTEQTTRVASRNIRQAGGLDAYARRLVTSEYGAEFPVKANHVI
jgi:hypothetical protein